jgi:DNA mismatch repair protein MutL
VKKIHILPEDVAQKIAAGEVIERPVSVVKELVENSLDAGATAVRIELVDGGKASIKVVDDGAGMDREDAALCFRRHSTSKIAREEDLERISTLGFRGEALASIAAVSRLTLRTSDGTTGRGTVIEREGERLVSVTEIAFPRGTSIEVRDLFFNLPARRKFLRSGQSELGPVTKYVTQAALAGPGVRFTLVHGAREILACPPVGTLRERVFELFGRKMVDGLMDVAAAEEEARLEGLASLPLAGRADKSVQHFFVNGRPVKDRILMAALAQAYSGILEKGRSPEAFLFLRVPYGDVDVNVHPAKSEVRFRDTQLVFRLVLRAVGEGAARGHTIKEVVTPDGGRLAPVSGIAEEKGSYPSLGPGFGPDEADVRASAPAFRPAWGAEPGAAPAEGKGPIVLGQYANMYIVVAAEDGLLVVDQHNAHERILFDKFRDIDRRRLWPRKALLVPPVLELPPSAAVALEANAVMLEEMGFRIEPMGGRSFALKEYPDVFRTEEAADVFLGLIEEAAGTAAEDRRERMLATMACKAAIKAGEPLTREKMGYLVAELFKTSQPALCPHGRPIVVRVERSLIDKTIGRH